MKVIRYTFDICFGKNISKDVYSMAIELEKGIMKVDGVCGCEVKTSHAFLANCVEVDKVIEEQNKRGWDNTKDKCKEGGADGVQSAS